MSELPMTLTLEEAIAEARRRPGADALAVFVREVLGIAPSCGMIKPEVYPSEVIIPRDMVGNYEPDDAIALGVLIVAAGLEAKGQKR